MSTYIFILGKDPELSVAELSARYPASNPVNKGEEFAILESDLALDQAEFNDLGGQIKAGKVFERTGKKELILKIADHLLTDHYAGKLNYGISVYGWAERNLRTLLLDIKKEFKRRGVSSRFANQNFINISVAQYKGLSGGKEILVCKDEDDYLLAEVVAVQDIDGYSERDFYKPFRDMKVGMLPPKLAQIMINLLGPVGTIWDPFCGGGVLIMEGLLMGHSMLGSDINAKTLEGAIRNVQWVKKAFRVDAEADLFLHDATKPLPRKKFDAIAFEGYLGPPQDRIKFKREFADIIAELGVLYRSFFAHLKVGNFCGPIVVGLPFYKTKDGELFLDEVISKIEKMGFKIDIELKYARQNQLVGRHILRLHLVS